MIAAVNSVIAFFYYFARRAADVVRRAGRGRSLADPRPAALAGAIALMGAVVVVIGIYPQLFARIGERAF